MPLERGDKLGPYEILEPIGKGGMGEVWKARDTRLNRNVAVKRLNGLHTARFAQEARAIAALNHPHICQIFDIGPDYLVLEYIEGQPLLSHANPGPLPVEEVIRLAVQIAEALDAAHRKGVVHRDLKPANILVTADGSVKLLDFGLAKQVALSAETAADETGTIEGTVMGTAAYMAPEQAAGQPLDARSDIFSFGAVLYELLSGRQPFRGENAISTMAAILHTEPAPLDAPAALQQILKRCLAKPPAQRYQTAAELRQALRGWAQMEAPAPLQPSIAVLPFANMGADQENEYFSDGLAEEIINFLAQIPGLKVTARTSAFAFRGKEQDIRKIASALGVATILEGSVRRSGNRIRVTAQLINAADGYHLWSQRYDREMADLFDLQDEIAHAIASTLQVKLSGAPAPFEQHKPNLPAYEALLKARHYLGSFRPDLLPSIKGYFEQAIALDPKFALAHCEYGGYFGAMALVGTLPANYALPMMSSLARTALELEPSLPEGHAMLGYVAACLQHDWEEAERRFRVAMARDPIPVFVRLYYVMGYLLPTGRAPEAVRQIDLAVQGDPLNLTLRVYRALCLAAAGRDQEAVAGYREVLEFNPAVPAAQGALAAYQTSRGELDQALADCEKAYALAPVPQAIGLLAGLLRRTGDTRRAEELLAKLDPDAVGAPRGLALYHWALQEFDAEADCLATAIDQHDPYGAIYLRVWYGREQRSTPRWAELMRKLALPEP
jgi:TolB-like protein/tRNA A-37 threonylcarbamoyl transferase component Bud32/Tfp pilus assembly protein PilF